MQQRYLPVLPDDDTPLIIPLLILQHYLYFSCKTINMRSELYRIFKGMNKGLLYVSLMLVLLITSCTEEKGKGRQQQKVLYKSINKDDTASLRIILTDRTFEGQYEINYHGLYKDSGDVNGIIKGDTLKGTYHYQHYGTEEFYRIPIALLKKNNKLIMGVGDMEIYMNMTFFKKTVPIDYKNPKFIFEQMIDVSHKP
jgi:hypothetical protein